MRIPIDPGFAARAKAEGLPMFRVQIDWRHVPKDKRVLKSHEACGVTDMETAKGLMRLSMHELVTGWQTAESTPEHSDGK